MVLKRVMQVRDMFRVGAKPDEVIEVITPTIDRKTYYLQMVHLAASSLPLPIKATHQYNFRNTDFRKAHMLGNDHITLTNVEACKHSIQRPINLINIKANKNDPTTPVGNISDIQ